MNTTDKLATALRNLLDEQNGPPLIRHEKSWQAAVDAAEEALASHRSQQQAEAAPLQNIESPFNACMHKDYCLSLKAAAPAASGGLTDERAGYEVAFKKPSSVTWNGREYDCREGYENSYAVERFISGWNVWIARAALSASQPEARKPMSEGEPPPNEYTKKDAIEWLESLRSYELARGIVTEWSEG